MSEDFRVLIVDDDFHVAKLHAAYVDSVAGFLALAPAGSASQALQAIHSLRPDLVLLDVYLPDASGLDLLHQLDVDTMILSAASDTASLRVAFRRGALGYLLKPFTAESLSRQLRSYARYRRILAQPGNATQDTVERAKRALIPGTSRSRPNRGPPRKRPSWNRSNRMSSIRRPRSPPGWECPGPPPSGTCQRSRTTAPSTSSCGTAAPGGRSTVTDSRPAPVPDAARQRCQLLISPLLRKALLRACS